MVNDFGKRCLESGVTVGGGSLLKYLALIIVFVLAAFWAVQLGSWIVNRKKFSVSRFDVLFTAAVIALIMTAYSSHSFSSILEKTNPGQNYSELYISAHPVNTTPGDDSIDATTKDTAKIKQLLDFMARYEYRRSYFKNRFKLNKVPFGFLSINLGPFTAKSHPLRILIINKHYIDINGKNYKVINGPVDFDFFVEFGWKR